jgi:hypothetical protein
MGVVAGSRNLRQRMSLFANYRADRLIADIKSSANQASPVAQKALDKLIALGPNAIDPIVAALANAEKKETLLYVEALSKLIDSRTLPHVLKIMSDANAQQMPETARPFRASAGRCRRAATIRRARCSTPCPRRTCRSRRYST